MVKMPIYNKTKKLPEGTILKDIMKVSWELGLGIGQGGFGCIYLAKQESSKDFDKVIKIEPSSNGPLFTEINFYRRAAKEVDILKWVKENKLKFLGMPVFRSSGMFEDNRFIVMDRFGDDLHKTLTKVSLTPKCILQISINMVDVLEYIHSKGYAHADIKAMNIMRGYANPSEVYLLDFGMVSLFKTVEKPDPKSKHNGTVEFCARDSHRGLSPACRGDIESLFYNMVFWLTWSKENAETSRGIGLGCLPWLSLLRGTKSDKIGLPVIEKVAQSKEENVKNPEKFIESIGLNVHSWSKYLVEMLKTINGYSYCDRPDYDKLRTTIASIISEIDGKPVSVTNNRLVDWDSKPSPHVAERRSSRKRLTNEIAPEEETKRKRSNPIVTVKKIDDTKLEANNKNLISSGVENKKPKKITKKIEAIDTPVSILKKRTTKPETLKEQNADDKNDATVTEAKNSPRVVRRSIIPGKKAIDDLKARRLANSKEAAANEIIPGRKNLRRFQTSTRKSPRATKTTGISVSCQTSPI